MTVRESLVGVAVAALTCYILWSSLGPVMSRMNELFPAAY